MIVGVDIGGTFTDVVCIDRRSGEIHFTKVSTNYIHIIAGVLDGVRKILGLMGTEASDIKRIAHGTTIATNVVVQRKGAKTSVFTTKGFEDVLEIGRLKRNRMYDLNIDVQTPIFLSPRRLRVGVPERLDTDGKVIIPLDEAFVAEAITDMRTRHSIEAVSVVYLYAFKEGVHERRTRDIIKNLYPDLYVSLSSEVNPIFREYERTVVTTFDAYMRPAVETFMTTLEQQLRDFGLNAEVHVMQSRGGVTSTRIAAQRPVNLFLSGPAAGVVGGAQLAQATNHPDVVTIDIGGTSSDVALISDGVPSVNPSGEIAGYTVPISMVGINTIGAGGGSLLWMDASDMMRVGPGSAGSDPGPACYGRGGTEPTITDASLLLNYLNPFDFAGGEVQLDLGAAERTLAGIADRMGMSGIEAALGAHRIINVQMAEQIRLITIKKGHDPRQFTLMAFGGAGPLHAGALASMLGMKGCLIPQTPGVLSAFGLLSANVEVEQQTSYLTRIEDADPDNLAATLKGLEDSCLDIMREDGISVENARARFSADLRYIGQSHEITVPLADDVGGDEVIRHVIKDYEDQYVRLYGFSNKTDIEIVNLRAVAYKPAEVLNDLRLHGPDGDDDVAPGERDVWFLGGDRALTSRIYQRDRLRPGMTIAGPSIIEQADTTTVVYPGQTAVVDARYNLLIGGISEAYTQ
jgi:N-methylhydantoinase A/oxoprolinase/acetone carboxylase beta subunit